MSENQKIIRTQRGRVVSDKMDHTVSVLLERRVKHPIYGKYITRTSKVLAHDERNECKTGDIVSITSCKPISKRKAWKVLQIVEKVAS